jgi:arsenate reductase
MNGRGAAKTGPCGILFLCVANSARSQMAEGLARSLAPPSVAVFSAGSEPTRLNPVAIQAMAQVGIDIRAQRSKPVTDVPLHRVDLVVTLCAEEVCGEFPLPVEHLHWPHEDPAAVEGRREEVLEAFSGVRDQIESKLKTLFAG